MSQKRPLLLTPFTGAMWLIPQLDISFCNNIIFAYDKGIHTLLPFY